MDIRRNYAYRSVPNGVQSPTNIETMTNNFQKFGLLMWKNWLLHKRKPLQSFLEILAPVIFSVFLVLIRSLIDPEQHDPTIYDRFCPLPLNSNSCFYSSPLNKFRNPNDIVYSLAYSPKNDKIENAIQTMRVIMNSMNVTLNVAALNNSNELEQYFNTPDGNTTLAGIQLDDSLYGNVELPLNLEVSIRFPSELRASGGVMERSNWNTFLLYPIYQMAGPRSINFTTGGSPSYYNEGFLGVQQTVTYLLIIAQDINIGDLQELPFIQMQRFPYPEFTDDPLLQALISFVGIIIMLSFVYSCINTVKMITTEKEQQLKEAMKIMGLSNWLHWSAWFVKSFIFLFISVILIVVLLKIKWYPGTEFSVFTYADASVMLVFMTLYMCSTITFCFAISVFFSKANTAAQIGAVVWFLSYAPYLFLQQSYDTLGLSTKLLSSLGSNTAMAYGFQVMLMYEGVGEGIQWNNIWKSSSPDDTLTLGYIMLMLILDAFIYLLIALYFEAVFPGEYGVPQKWYFFCTPSFWCGQPRNIMVEDFSNSSYHDPHEFEKEPDHLPPGIQIRNLKKQFQKKTAVRDLSLNMYENQITVLLGHNGAGKTTTMSMLTGLLQPSAGTAIVAGYDIRTNMRNIRDSLGLCPQHNILFEDMTVSEHLYFFSKLKGLKSSQIKQEIKKYLQLLELEPKANKMSKTLSGGMKRKLCVGMAMCGNSKVVMLDEPTAGMDPSARRALWDLIQSQKPGRTILLTTHFMDEADLLGDRIAIMAGGKLQCCGSSFFLKKRYGAGYYLIMEKSPTCQTSAVTQFLSKYIPNIKIENNVGSELTYLLEESNASQFRNMLGDLELHSTELGIITFGISLTTLEEVFMKVGADHGQEETNDLREQDKLIEGNGHSFNQDAYTHQPEKSIINMGRSKFLTGMPLIQNQIIAMLMKRILSIFRSYITYIIALFLPVVFLIIAIVVGRAQITTELPPLEISLASYRDPVTLYDKNETEFCNFYVNSIQHENFNTLKVDNISTTMLNLTKENPGNVRQSYLVGASFEGVQDIIINNEPPISLPVINAWFNNDPYHTPPLALGLVLNSVYQKLLNASHSIKFINHPLPYTAKSQISQLLQQNNMGFQISFNIGFSMAFVTSIFILFYIRERVCKSKHLQFVSGIKVLVFWCTNLFCDLLVYIVISVAVIITLAAFQEDGFASSSDLGRIFIILLYFGVAIIPLMYLASYLFEVPSTGFVRMSLFGVFTGVAFFLIVQVLSTPGLDLEYVANALHWVFLVFPHYSLCSGVQESYTLYATNKVCDRIYEQCVTSGQQNCTEAPCLMAGNYCCDIDQEYYKWAKGGIGRNIFYSYFTAVVFFGVVLAKEYRVFAVISYMIKSRMGGKFPQDVPDEDSDVSAEKTYIRNVPNDELFKKYTLVLKDVTKYYGKFLAVNGTCLGVKKNECFGLLGINGAGKTTTFKMMTGDVKITYGEAWVQGYSVKNQMKSVQKLIGYCPQFDAVLNDLTARETVTMFCLIRGIPYSETRYIGEKLSRDFDFYRHLDKKVKALSGGNKRKLSTALALVGDPEIIYLDEPTTGMDPATKRFLWNALCKVRDSGKCLVLTSHSMEECEALCTRLAIMVNGNFKCLGSTQHLKNKFSEGYTITIKLKKQDGDKDNIDTEIIERYIKEHFPSSHLREKHQEMLTYYIPEKNLSWSTMFGILEDGKNRLNIEDYTLGQTSLEQVFLSFTKYSESQDS